MPKKVLIALPPAMLEQVDFIAQCEHRNRSDLIREALRRYLDNFRRTQISQASVNASQPVPMQPVKQEEKIEVLPVMEVVKNEPKEEEQPEPTKEVAGPVIPFFNRSSFIG